MKILGIHHVQVTIPMGAEERGRAFYCGVLGLPEIPKPESLMHMGGFWIAVGDQAVHVGVEDGFDRLTTKGHVAYQVEDLAAARAAIVAAGCTPVESVVIPGLDRFEFRDPFGNRVEILQVIF